MASYFRYIKNPIKKYTFLLLATAFLGTHFLSIDVGLFQLSPYRILLLLSPFVFLYVSDETKQKFRAKSNYSYFQFLLLWLIYSIFTLLWIKDLSAWINIFSFLICGCITSWFIGYYICDKKDWINALKIIEICAFVSGSLGVYEIITGNYMFIPDENTTFYEGRSALFSTIGIRIPISIFGNPNDFALFLLFAIFGSIALYKVKNTYLGRIISLILVIYFFFLLLASQSRSGFLGFLLALIPLAYLYPNRFPLNKRLLFMIVGLIILSAISSWIIANRELYEALITIDTSTGSDRIRVNLIKNGFVFLVNSLFMGVGLGNIEYYMATNVLYSTRGITNIHNWWMEILVSSGLIIFIIYLAIYTKSLWGLWKMSKVRKDKDNMNISTCFFCFLVAFLVGSVGSSSLMTAEWLWPVMALVMNYVNLSPKPIFTK